MVYLKLLHSIHSDLLFDVFLYKKESATVDEVRKFIFSGPLTEEVDYCKIFMVEKLISKQIRFDELIKVASPNAKICRSITNIEQSEV